VDALDALAERRIAAAIEAGVLEDLPGMGRPLALEDLLNCTGLLCPLWKRSPETAVRLYATGRSASRSATL
jgi:hypothetical protein